MADDKDILAGSVVNRLPGYYIAESKAPSLAEILSEFLPVWGDIRSAQDAYSTARPLAEALLSGQDMTGTGEQWGTLGLSALGALPVLGVLGDAGRAANKALDMSHAARMKRADDAGFDTSKIYFHGTKGDIDAFDLERAGTNTGATNEHAAFFSDNPAVAEEYASYDIAPEDWGVLDRFDKEVMEPALEKEHEAFTAFSKKKTDDTLRKRWDIAKKEREDAESAQIALEQELLHTRGRLYPVFLQRGDVIDMDGASYSPHAMERLIAEGDPVTYLKNFSDSRAGIKATTALVTDPTKIRAIFAAFDPARKDSADLLASAAPYMLPLPLAAALMSSEENQ